MYLRILFACFVYSVFFVISSTSMNMNVTEGVSRELATERAAGISELGYKLKIEIVPGTEKVIGKEEISFTLSVKTDPIVIDFRDLDEQGRTINGRISDLAVNGVAVADARQVNGHIIIPGDHFKAGENRVSLSFETKSSAAGRPLIRYLDRDDGSEYVYTLFVPMDASLAFPCFDQPDLKAKFHFSVRTKSDWTVIGNSRLERRSPDGDGVSIFEFEPTPPISTYLFAFAAGPFQIFNDETKPEVDLRVLVRKSQVKRAAEHLPEVFSLTRSGMKHYIDYFDHRFPFTKYDQVLLPGFAYGGMEHAGATFLREDSILFRTTPTRSDQLGRASLILHELAHQWFGDLVTMRWFDDLWLKEGFANFMAYHSMAAIYDRSEIWKRFYQALKPLAYNIDSTKGTTPIYQKVPNLKDAKSAYGAIVYQKAPAILKQLSNVIGEDNFRSGVRLFVKKHAYSNAEWNDLIGAFEMASGRSLGKWAEVWVRRRGMPQIETEWSCDSKGRIDRFVIKQRDVLGEGGIWPVKTRLMLAYENSPAIGITVSLDGSKSPVEQAIGQKCPLYVFANDADYGYGRYLLDQRSRDAVMTSISNITDDFHRTMLWGALWDAVREAELDPREYLALVMKSLPAEKDEELAQSLLDRSTRTFQRYLSDAARIQIAPKLEELCFERMMNAPDPGLRITYFRAFRVIATTANGRQKLKDLLSGRTSAQGVEIKQVDRWRILTSLIAQNDPEAESLLKIETANDHTDDGRKHAYIASAARADADSKQRYFNDYLSNRNVPEDWIEGSLGTFNSLNQSQLTLPYLKPALEALPQVKRQRKIFFVLAWLNSFIGGQKNPEALDLVKRFLKNNRLDRDLELKVLEVMDELERTVKIRR